MPALLLGEPGRHLLATATTFSYSPKPRGGKTHCDVCGREGYGQTGRPDRPAGWQKACMRGHWACTVCGRWMAALINGSRPKHARCPGRQTPLDPSIWLP